MYREAQRQQQNVARAQISAYARASASSAFTPEQPPPPLWLGHADIRSTTTYLHADMTIKERALQRMTPAAAPAGRFKPSDKLLAFLDAL